MLEQAASALNHWTLDQFNCKQLSVRCRQATSRPGKRCEANRESERRKFSCVLEPERKHFGTNYVYSPPG